MITAVGVWGRVAYAVGGRRDPRPAVSAGDVYGDGRRPPPPVHRFTTFSTFLPHASAWRPQRSTKVAAPHLDLLAERRTQGRTPQRDPRRRDAAARPAPRAGSPARARAEPSIGGRPLVGEPIE